MQQHSLKFDTRLCLYIKTTSLNSFKSKYTKPLEKLLHQRISRLSITSPFEPAPPILNRRRQIKASQNSLLKATKLITFFMYCSITYMHDGSFKEEILKDEYDVTRLRVLIGDPLRFSGTHSEQAVVDVCFEICKPLFTKYHKRGQVRGHTAWEIHTSFLVEKPEWQKSLERNRRKL